MDLKDYFLKKTGLCSAILRLRNQKINRKL